MLSSPHSRRLLYLAAAILAAAISLPLRAQSCIWTAPGALASAADSEAQISNDCGSIRSVGVDVNISMPSTSCYANCDDSLDPPVLTVADFTCFLQRFAAQDPRADCYQGYFQPPTFNIADFTCFMQQFANGCP